MRKIVFLLIASFALVFTACNKEKIDKVNPDNFEVNLNKAELQKRIEMINAPASFTNLKSGAAFTLPELWVVARIRPAEKSVTVWYWTLTFPQFYPAWHPKYQGGGRFVPTGGTTITRTTATNNAPVVDGFTMTAAAPASGTSADYQLSMTGAGISGGKAYFTSHINGAPVNAQNEPVYMGEIFVTTYTKGANTQATAITAQASIFDNETDYNEFIFGDVDDVVGTTTPGIWVLGDNNARGAVIRKIALAAIPGGTVNQNLGGNPLTFTMTKYNMPLLGPSGNSITLFTNPEYGNQEQLWVVAGGTTHGGIIVMDKNDDSKMFTRSDKPHAKHFDIGAANHGSGHYGAFLFGDNDYNNDISYLRIFNTSNGPFSYVDVRVPGDVTLYGKNALQVVKNLVADGGDDNYYAYIAMGADGVFKVRLNPGVAYTPDQLLVLGTDFTKFNNPNTYGGNGLANSLTVKGNKVYVAYGASGLVVLNRWNLDYIGNWNGIGSCNYVDVDDTDQEVLWVGNGVDGMILLNFQNDVGN